MKKLLADPLVLCILLPLGIVCLLLAFEMASNKKLTPLMENVFIHTLLFMITGVGEPPFTLLNPGSFAIPNRSIIQMGMTLGAYIFTACILHSWFRNFFPNSLTLSLLKDRFLGLFIILFSLSAFWSVTPIYTLRSSLAFLGMALVAAYIAEKYSMDEIAKIIRRSNAIVMFLSILSSQTARGRHGKGWKGLLGHPIYLGNLMALNIAMWSVNAIYNPRGRGFSLVVIMLSFLTMQMANSSGAFLTWIACMMMLSVLRVIRHLPPKLGFTCVFLVIVVSICGFILFKENEDSVFAAMGKDSSLSGRGEIWPMVIERIKKRPWLGYGVNGFWQRWRGADDPAFGIASPTSGWVPPHSHQGWYDMTVQVGIIGLILFMISLVNTTFKAVVNLTRQKPGEGSFFPLIFFTQLMMINMSDSNLLNYNTTWFYYVIVAVKLSLEVSRKNLHTLEKKN